MYMIYPTAIASSKAFVSIAPNPGIQRHLFTLPLYPLCNALAAEPPIDTLM